MAGEELSLRYEQARLHALGIQTPPRLLAIEDNSLGYDIESWDVNDSGEQVPLRIEVKAHSSGEPRFFLTRNEWEVGQRLGPTYLLHVWDLGRQALRTISVEEVGLSVPLDRGAGRWKVVEVAV